MKERERWHIEKNDCLNYLLFALNPFLKEHSSLKQNKMASVN